MTRSHDAGPWRPALITACLAFTLSAPALAADWQPITGSQSQTTPRPTTQPSGSGSGGYGNIPTWGRGGGWSGEPDHPHPPATTPAPATSAGCSLSLDPQTAVAGDYATVIATFSDAALRDLGRMDLLVDGRPAAGATRQGNGFTYAFRVPAGQRQVDVSLTAYASRTGNYGQIRILCSAAASLTVMDLILDAPRRALSGQIFSAAASVVGGRPPFTFAWWPSGRLQNNGSESTYFNNFDGTGTRTVSVEVTDGAGRKISKSQRFELVGCPGVTLSGPTQLKEGERGQWTAVYPTKFPPVRYQFRLGNYTHVRSNSSNRSEQFAGQARSGTTSVSVTVTDAAHCTATQSHPITVTEAPSATTRSNAGSTTIICRNIHGCTCPGNGLMARIGEICCGSVVCQQGAKCVSPGTCR